MQYRLSHLLFFVALSAVAIVWFRSLPTRHSGQSGFEHGVWADGNKTVPRYYWGTVRHYDATKFGFMIRVTDERFLNREIKWLKIDRGRLYVDRVQFFAKPNSIRLAFAENDGSPRVVDLDPTMAKEFVSLQGYGFSAGSLSLYPEAQKMNHRIEDFWDTISTGK